MRLRYPLATGIVTGGVLALSWLAATTWMERNDRQIAKLRAHGRDQFEKGYWFGVHTVADVIKLDTNSGKFTLEITNLLAALREADRTNQALEAP